jgi:hypothetical protein
LTCVKESGAAGGDNAAGMEPALVQELRRQRKQIRRRWETFLRLEKATSPLANPDTLVFGVDRSLGEIFSGLLRPAGLKPPRGPARECGCGRHPLRAYYRAGEQAVLEALVLTQARRAPCEAAQRDREFAEVKAVVTALAQRDIAALAGVCQLPPDPPPPPGGEE